MAASIKNFSASDQKSTKSQRWPCLRVLILYYRGGYTDGGGKFTIRTLESGLKVPGRNLVGSKTPWAKQGKIYWTQEQKSPDSLITIQ